mmetsp:Transcript_41726/g.131526  ORF Transcript_41726/g.131526 Transcript_41726/m.131526 type:complete len:344 (+) Transcript_41726:639-1670(+)
MGARYLICTLERTWAMNPSADRMNVICNCQNLTFSNYEHAMCLICLEILGEQYPDNMQYCFMFPAGWIMQAIMAIGRPMMSDETYHKHKILSSDKYRDCLAEHYDRDQLEEDFGGTLDPASSLRRRWLLEDPARLQEWLAEEDAAHQSFAPSEKACDLQRQVLPHDKKDLAGSSRAAPAPCSEPFGHCRDLWSHGRARTLEQGEEPEGLRESGWQEETEAAHERRLNSESSHREVEDASSDDLPEPGDDHGSPRDDEIACVEGEAAQPEAEQRIFKLGQQPGEAEGTACNPASPVLTRKLVFSTMGGWKFVSCCASVAVQSGACVGRSVAKVLRSTWDWLKRK